LNQPESLVKNVKWEKYNSPAPYQLWFARHDLTPVERSSLKIFYARSSDITVESEPGRGSTFTIRVPRIVEASKAIQ
jgi:hypothetical protein